MATDLEASRKRASNAEAALAAQRSASEERVAPLERELAQMRIVVAVAKATQQKEQRNSDDLRQRLAALGDEVCDLHLQKDQLHAQLASQHTLLCEQHSEREKLEAKLKQALQRGHAMPQPAMPTQVMPSQSLAPSAAAPPSSMAPAAAPSSALPGARLPSANLPSANLPSANLPSANLPSANLPSANEGALAATVAALQQEMFALRHAVQPPAQAASAGLLPLPPAAAQAAAPPPPAGLPMGGLAQPPLFERSASAPASAAAFQDAGMVDGGAEGAVRTSRSRRGGRGKGNKANKAAVAEALATVKENAPSNGGNANWQLGAAQRTLMQEAELRRSSSA